MSTETSRAAEERAHAAAAMLTTASGSGLGEHLTCTEANAVRDWIADTLGAESAEQFIRGHAFNDEEGDDPEHLTKQAEDQARYA